MSDLLDQLRALDPERDGRSGAPPLGWLRALLDVTPPPRRGSRRPIAVVVALACLAALALVVVVVLGGSSSGPRRDALVPANGDGPVIVHLVTRTTMSQPGSRRAGAGLERIGTLDGPVERWMAGPRRWRQRITLLPGRGMPGGWSESAYADGVMRSRDSRRRGVRQQRLPAPGARIEPALLFAGPPRTGATALLGGSADPRTTVERMIRDGEVRSLGETTRDGRRLLRLSGEMPRRRIGRVRAAGTRTTWLVDAETYVPVELNTQLDLGFSRAPSFDDGTRTVFDTYETLPLNAATAPLLRLGGPTR